VNVDKNTAGLSWHRWINSNSRATTHTRDPVNGIQISAMEYQDMLRDVEHRGWHPIPSHKPISQIHKEAPTKLKKNFPIHLEKRSGDL